MVLDILDECVVLVDRFPLARQHLDRAHGLLWHNRRTRVRLCCGTRSCLASATAVALCCFACRSFDSDAFMVRHRAFHWLFFLSRLCGASCWLQDVGGQLGMELHPTPGSDRHLAHINTIACRDQPYMTLYFQYIPNLTLNST